MAEFLVFAQKHWMDDLTTEEIQNYAMRSDTFMDHYDARYQRGDIVEVQENGHWLGRRGWGFPKFVLIRVADLSLSAAKKYMETWKRGYAIEVISSDVNNHIYDIRISLVQAGTSVADYYDSIRDRLNNLPPDISVLSRGLTQVTLRIEPLKYPDVINGKMTAEERYNAIKAKKEKLPKLFRKLIRQRRNAISVNDLPAGVRQQLQTDGYYITTIAQVQSYLLDKANT